MWLTNTQKNTSAQCGQVSKKWTEIPKGQVPKNVDKNLTANPEERT